MPEKLNPPDVIEALEADVPAHAVALGFEYNKQAAWFHEWWGEFGWDQFKQWVSENKEQGK